MGKSRGKQKSKRFGLGVVLLVIGFGLVAAGCEEEGSSSPDSTIAVSDNTADFGAFRTFMIVEPPEESDPDRPPEDITDGDQLVIDNQIIAELEALELTKVADGADLLISSFVTVDTVDATATGYWYEYYYYYGWWTYYDYWYYDDEVQFDVGTLVIDAVATNDLDDDEDDRLVFRGASMGIVTGETSERTERLQEGVTLIFGEWPESEE